MGRPNWRRTCICELPVVCAVVILLVSVTAVGVQAARRPLPQAACAVDRAATEIAETADATESVVRWVHAKCLAWDEAGKIRGRLMFKVLGVPIMALEAELDLPKQKG